MSSIRTQSSTRTIYTYNYIYIYILRHKRHLYVVIHSKRSYNSLKLKKSKNSTICKSYGVYEACGICSSKIIVESFFDAESSNFK